MFKSVNYLQSDTSDLLHDYRQWVRAQASNGGILDVTTPTRAGELTNLATRVEAFQRRAQVIIDDPKWSTLTQDQQDDVRAIVEESKTGFDEIMAAVHPDNIWKTLGDGDKRGLTHGHVHAPEHVDLLRARLTHDIRKQAKIPPAPTDSHPRKT